MQVKCFYEDKPQSDVIFVIYSDFSYGQKFWKADKGWYGENWNFDDEQKQFHVDDDWFLDADMIWFIELKE